MPSCLRAFVPLFSPSRPEQLDLEVLSVEAGVGGAGLPFERLVDDRGGQRFTGDVVAAGGHGLAQLVGVGSQAQRDAVLEIEVRGLTQVLYVANDVAGQALELELLCDPLVEQDDGSGGLFGAPVLPVGLFDDDLGRFDLEGGAALGVENYKLFFFIS